MRWADVMAYPRRSDRLTEMVTPLKPLESMAQGVPVVASDVGGHRELLANGQTGFLHRAGSVDDLARAVSEVLLDSENAQYVAASALKHVSELHRWSVVCEDYKAVYSRLGVRQ